MSLYNFKKIMVVPPAKVSIDLLSNSLNLQRMSAMSNLNEFHKFSF